MEKAIFMTKNGQKAIDAAYSETCKAALCAGLTFDQPVFDEKDLDADAHKDVAYIFTTWGMLPLTEAQIDAFFPRLKAVFYAAGTVQYFARPFLAKGIAVFSAWAANAEPVAEVAFAHIVLANKGFYTMQRRYKNMEYFAAREPFKHYPGNYDVRIGLLGFGMIGSLLFERLKTLDVETLVYDPFLSEERAETLGVRKAGLEEIFATCDVVSNHIANNEKTKGMLDYPLFASMKPYATFMNTGRGAQTVEEDLVRVLTERQDLTGIIDVTDPHEPLPLEHPFHHLDNVVLTPHIAGSSGLEVRRMGEYMRKEYEAFAASAPTRYHVTLKMLETMA